MIFITGTRLYGKVDEVPGFFHVATQFFHLWYIPLIPLGSQIVVRKEGSKSFGVPLGLDVKSTLVAYARIWPIFLALFVSPFGLIFFVPQGKQIPIGNILIGVAVEAFCVLGVVGMILAWTMSSVRRASYPRAVKLAEKLKLSEEALVMIELAYNRVTEADAKATLESLRVDAEKMRELTQAAPPTSPSRA